MVALSQQPTPTIIIITIRNKAKTDFSEGHDVVWRHPYKVHEISSLNRRVIHHPAPIDNLSVKQFVEANIVDKCR